MPCRRFLVDLASSPSIRTVFLAGRWAPLVSGTVPETGGNSPGTFLKDDATTALSPQETLHVSSNARAIARSGRCAMGKSGHRSRQHSGAGLRRALRGRRWRATTAWGYAPANTIGRARRQMRPPAT